MVAPGPNQSGWFARLTANADPIQSFGVGDGHQQVVNGATIAEDGDARLCGDFYSSVNLLGTHVSGGDTDGFIARVPAP